MCSAHDCNDTPASRPQREVTVSVADASNETGSGHLEVSTHLTPAELAADIVRVYQDKVGKDYARVIDASR